MYLYICLIYPSIFSGEKGVGETTNKPLHYKGVTFHRVIRDFMLQAGDFSEGIFIKCLCGTV